MMKNSRRTDDTGVIQAFMDQQSAKSPSMKTDGQSLFSFDTRIAEHIPDGSGRAATIVYDYTYGGGAYVSPTTSNHVRLTKKQVPRPNWMTVDEARDHGLVTEPIPQVRNGKTSSNT
tara:strand:+ start:1141 stop:1491 length:351 start_codon:yes stop_codon:yes gene_type:complete